jgi:hypothetical protein
MARFSSALDAQQVINVLDNCIYLGKPFGCRFDRLITGGFKPQNDGDKKESPMMGKFQQENGVLPSEGNPEYKSNYIQATQMKQPGPFRNQENVQFAPGQYQQAMQPSMQQVMGHSMQQPMQQSLMQSQPNFGQFGQASNENRFQTNSSMNDYGFPTPNLGRPPPSAIYGSANTPVKRPNPYSSQIRDDTRSRSPLRKQQTGDDDDVQKLASRLGISKKMLNAIRVLANDEYDDATDQSKPETSTPTDNKNVNFSQGANSHGTNSPKPSVSNYGHEATTMDTIYVRNIPGHFSELRLRSFMKECGEVTFMDFPLKSDGTPVGYAYVRFGGQECKESARKAISDFDKMVLDNFKLEVGMY